MREPQRLLVAFVVIIFKSIDVRIKSTKWKKLGENSGR